MGEENGYRTGCVGCADCVGVARQSAATGVTATVDGCTVTGIGGDREGDACSVIDRLWRAGVDAAIATRLRGNGVAL